MGFKRAGALLPPEAKGNEIAANGGGEIRAAGEIGFPEGSPANRALRFAWNGAPVKSNTKTRRESRFLYWIEKECTLFYCPVDRLGAVRGEEGVGF